MNVQATANGSTTPTVGRREQKRSSTRRELLLAGRKLFSQEGLYDSRIEDITEHAGIAKGTLYLYFRSKEDLVKAVVSEGFEELRDHVDERIKGQRSLKGAASAVFSAHLGFFEENPDLMRILHQVRGVLKFDKLRWRPLRTQLRLHLEFLAQRLAVGEGRTWTLPRRRELAIFLFGCASGTSSVLVATYPESARLRSWDERWSDPIGQTAAAAAANGTLARARSRQRPRPS